MPEPAVISISLFINLAPLIATLKSELPLLSIQPMGEA